MMVFIFDKDYYCGSNSNYIGGYDLLKFKFLWNDKIKEIIKVKREGNLLDVGCAFGFFKTYGRYRF